MLSIDDLPKDDSGLIPAGLWHVELAANLTDGFAGMSFERGLSTRPLDGRSLVRVTANMGILGAVRIEGAPCELGEVARIRTMLGTSASAPAVPAAVPAAAPAKAPEAEPVPEAPAPQEAPQALPPTPTSLAELEALTEAEARALAAEMGSTDKRWSVQKVRRFVADELGL